MNELSITIGTKREILTLAYEELSRIAQRAVVDNGTPVYDAIIPHSSDVRVMCVMVEEAFHLLTLRLSFAYKATEVSSDDEVKTFRVIMDLPDLPAVGHTSIGMAVRRYLALYVVANFIRERYKPLAEEYGQICESQLKVVVSELLKRDLITRRC